MTVFSFITQLLTNGAFVPDSANVKPEPADTLKNLGIPRLLKPIFSSATNGRVYARPARYAELP